MESKDTLNKPPLKAEDSSPEVPSIKQGSIMSISKSSTGGAQDTHEEELKKLVKENQYIFKEALDIFDVEANATEKKWLHGKYKPDQTRPPGSLEGFIGFLYGANKRIANTSFEKLYLKVRGCESSLRHFGIVLDSISNLIPEPGAGAAGLACKPNHLMNTVC